MYCTAIAINSEPPYDVIMGAFVQQQQLAVRIGNRKKLLTTGIENYLIGPVSRAMLPNNRYVLFGPLSGNKKYPIQGPIDHFD